MALTAESHHPQPRGVRAEPLRRTSRLTIEGERPLAHEELKRRPRPGHRSVRNDLAALAGGTRLEPIRLAEPAADQNEAAAEVEREVAAGEEGLWPKQGGPTPRNRTRLDARDIVLPHGWSRAPHPCLSCPREEALPVIGCAPARASACVRWARHSAPSRLTQPTRVWSVAAA